MATARKVVPLKSANREKAPLPESLKIGPLTYAVRHMDLQESLQSGLIGHYSDNYLVIAIADHVPDQRAVEVMIHEIFHACFDAGSLRDNGPLAEEQVVTVLAKQFLMVLLDNPELRAWMADRQPGLLVP